jgi:multidrug efflux pump subunit AcrB
VHRLSKLSLANRSVVALITAIIAIFGFVSLGSLKQELIPSIETPQAAIVTTYIGASPEVIDKQVSQPIDTAVRALGWASFIDHDLYEATSRLCELSLNTAPPPRRSPRS